MNRRDVINGILKGIAGTALAGFSGCSKDNKSISNSNRQYRSGDIIDDIGVPIILDGWNVLIGGERLMEYAENNPEGGLEFLLLGETSKNFPQLQAGFGVVGFYTGSVSRDGVSYWKMTMAPSSDSFSNVYLVCTQKSKGGASASKTYPLEWEAFTYKENNDGSPRIISEIPLDDRLIEILHEQHKIFDGFTHPCKVYIFKTDKSEEMLTEKYFEENRGGVYKHDESRIEFPSIIFTNPAFPNEGQIKMYHELAHVIMGRVLYNDRDQRINIALFNSYEKLVKAAGFEIPMPSFALLGPPDEVEDNPYFSIFDESSYLRGKVDERFIRGYGHPFNNHNEMFASALTVMRFFTDELIERYTNLGNNEKFAVKNFATEVLNVLETINPDIEALQSILPKYTTLKKLFS